MLSSLKRSISVYWGGCAGRAGNQGTATRCRNCSLFACFGREARCSTSNDANGSGMGEGSPSPRDRRRPLGAMIPSVLFFAAMFTTGWA